MLTTQTDLQPIASKLLHENCLDLIQIKKKHSFHNLSYKKKWERELVTPFCVSKKTKFWNSFFWILKIIVIFFFFFNNAAVT